MMPMIMIVMVRNIDGYADVCAFGDDCFVIRILMKMVMMMMMCW